MTVHTGVGMQPARPTAAELLPHLHRPSHSFALDAAMAEVLSSSEE